MDFEENWTVEEGKSTRSRDDEYWLSNHCYKNVSFKCLPYVFLNKIANCNAMENLKNL
jgi:hypothetical protein